MANFSGTAGNDTLAGGVNNDTFSASLGNDTVDGAGGSNYLDYASGSVGPITVTYAASGYSGTVVKSGLNGTDQFSNIRGILGSAGNDTLTGSDDATANLPYGILLRGRAGDDVIDGRKSQLNSATYFDSANGVTIHLQSSTDGNGNWFGTVNDGNQISGQPAGTYYTDMLKNVMRAGGSTFDDTIAGSAVADRFDATTGNDVYDGGNGFNGLSYNSAGLLSSVTVAIAVAASATGLFALLWQNEATFQAKSMA
jgi:Ca2+-binding RTX toxin-like protein